MAAGACQRVQQTLPKPWQCSVRWRPHRLQVTQGDLVPPVVLGLQEGQVDQVGQGSPAVPFCLVGQVVHTVGVDVICQALPGSCAHLVKVHLQGAHGID